MSNVVIVGSGPAGISAALYIRRAGFPVTVLHRGPGALEKAEAIENYYGFSEPIEGVKLWKNGVENATRLGVTFVHDEVVGFAFGGIAGRPDGQGALIPPTAVVIATGSPRKTPPSRRWANSRVEASATAPPATAFSTAARTWP
jgi:thioredoxin reductase (NADPH)